MSIELFIELLLQRFPSSFLDVLFCRVLRCYYDGLLWGWTSLWVHLTVNKSSMRANGEEGTTAFIVAIVTLQPPDAGTLSGTILVKYMSEAGFDGVYRQLEDNTVT